MSNNKTLNDSVREIFAKAIQDGYKKNHVCALTLGNQCVPQFDGFIKGRDFGIKPMERTLSAFDYEVHIVPVAKTDHESIAAIDGMTNACLDNMTQLLLSSLDKESLKSNTRKNPMFKEQADEILTELGFATETVKED